MPELHHGKTDPEVVKQQRGEKRSSGSSPGASSNGLARKPDKNTDRRKIMGKLERRVMPVRPFTFYTSWVCCKKGLKYPFHSGSSHPSTLVTGTNLNMFHIHVFRNI